jgi:hypothetical protein
VGHAARMGDMKETDRILDRKLNAGEGLGNQGLHGRILLNQGSSTCGPRVHFVRPARCLGDKLKFGPCTNK